MFLYAKIKDMKVRAHSKLLRFHCVAYQDVLPDLVCFPERRPGFERGPKHPQARFVDIPSTTHSLHVVEVSLCQDRFVLRKKSLRNKGDVRIC